VTGLTRLELRRVELDLDPPQSNARGTWTRRTALLLELHGPSGVEGRGEASPLPEYSRDDIDGCERALASIEPEQIAALDRRPVAELLAAAAALVPAELPAARFGLETALLDRAARWTGRPLFQLLPEPIATVAASQAPLCALLPSGEPGLARERARAHVRAGITTFKLKLGPGDMSGPQAATLAGLREEFGDRIALRVDANRSLERATWAATLARLAVYRVELVEEPLERPLPEELAGSPCPIALDESLQGADLPAIERWIVRGRVRAVVLKPTALGGFQVCLQIARLAAEAGCDAIVSHALEGPIGWAACAHLALALRSPRAAGLWPLAHQAAPSPPITGGRLSAPTAPGLGTSP